MTVRVMTMGGYPVEVSTPDDDSGNSAAITASKITDASTIGRAVLTAADAAAARKGIGAGTSNLKVGAAATDAKPGDYKPAVADIIGASDIGRKILAAKDADEIKKLLGIAP